MTWANNWIKIDSNGNIINTDDDVLLFQNGSYKRSTAFTLPLASIVDRTINLVGEFRSVTDNETTDYTTNFSVGNQHLYLYVNNIAGSGNVTITGTSIDEATGVPTLIDTEVIAVDTSTGLYYQTDKKWWEISSIDIPAGITVIDYNIGIVGYIDIHNTDFKLLGYRLDCYMQSNTGDLRLQIFKIQDDQDKKMSLVLVEDIGFDSGVSGNQIIDTMRSTRSYTPTTSYVAENNSTITFKCSDLLGYFSNEENFFRCSTGHEGIVIRFSGLPSGGTSGVDFATIRIDLQVFPNGLG